MKRTSPKLSAKPPHPGTGKRRRCPQGSRGKPDWMDCLDRIHGCCRTVEMLGQLMDGYGNEPLAAGSSARGGQSA